MSDDDDACSVSSTHSTDDSEGVLVRDVTDWTGFEIAAGGRLLQVPEAAIRRNHNLVVFDETSSVPDPAEIIVFEATGKSGELQPFWAVARAPDPKRLQRVPRYAQTSITKSMKRDDELKKSSLITKLAEPKAFEPLSCELQTTWTSRPMPKKTKKKKREAADAAAAVVVGTEDEAEEEEAKAAVEEEAAAGGEQQQSAAAARVSAEVEVTTKPEAEAVLQQRPRRLLAILPLVTGSVLLQFGGTDDGSTSAGSSKRLCVYEA